MEMSNVLFQAGYVYLADYRLLEGVTRYRQYGTRRYVTEPLVLFYTRESGDFVPLAIQVRLHLYNG